MGSNERRRKRFVRQSVYIAIGFAVLVAIVFYGRNLEQHQTHFFAKFKNPDGVITNELKLEIANTEAERNKGLMFRKSMAEDEGMIFVYPIERELSFWMKNTHISLDIVFIDSNWKVVGLIERLPILSLESRRSPKPGKYAIELLAGMASKLGIKEGSEVIFSGTAPEARE